MTQLLAANDPFTEGTPNYGTYPALYQRFNPWEAAGSTGESATGYLLRTDRVCDLHSGYFGSPPPPGVVDPISSTPASWKSNLASSASGGDRVFCAALERQNVAADVTAVATFQLYMIAGSAASDTFRYAGVCVRASGSPTYDATAGSERIINGDSYWLLICNNGTLGYKWKLVRVNAGSVTQLATQNISSIDLTRPHTMSLKVETSGGNVVLTAHSSKLSGTLGTIGGRTPVALFSGPITDSSGSKITASGRCGFGAFQDFQQSSGTVKSTTLVTAFEIQDSSATLVFRDEFVRASVYQCGSITADGNGISGRDLMCAWTSGSHGINARALERDSGNNRIAVTSTALLGHYSTRSATNPYTCWRSVRFNLLNPSGNPTSCGLALRGSWSTSAVVPGNYYELRIYHDEVASSGLFTAKLNFVNAFGVRTLLAQNTNLSAFSLTLNSNFDVEMRVRNVGGADETTGTPEITTLINSTAITWTNMAGSAVVLQADKSVLHAAAGGSGPWQGSVEGFLAFPGTSATVRVDSWTELSSVSGTTSTPHDEMVGISISGETDGATGTLSTPIDWGTETVTAWRQIRHRYDSGHVNVLLNSSRKRRMWRVTAHACTESERSTLLSFWDSHGGSDVPFNWVEPDGGATIVARFWTDDLGATLRAPGVTAFSFDLLEMLP